MVVNSTARYRVGIVGAGFVSDFHLRAWQKLSNVEVCAVCDPVDEALRRVQESYKIANVYSSIDKDVQRCRKSGCRCCAMARCVTSPRRRTAMAPRTASSRRPACSPDPSSTHLRAAAAPRHGRCRVERSKASKNRAEIHNWCRLSSFVLSA
jgi:hypothetical protein